jgi:hypothetical protein
VGKLRFQLAFVVLALTAGYACGSATPPVGSAARPTSTPQVGEAPSPTRVSSPARTPDVPAPTPTTAPANGGSAGLVKCEDLPKQVYSNKEYRFAIACPSGFWWETFRNQPPEWLFGSRVVEDRYKDRYPAGQVEKHGFPYDSDTLRHWIDTRIGTPFSGDSRHHWDSVSNVQESSVAGSTTCLQGQSHPPTFTRSRLSCSRSTCS